MKKSLSLLFISLTLLPGLAWSEESYLATPSTGTARFLLLDRATPDRLLSAGEEEDAAGEGPNLDAIMPIGYSSDSWNDVREQIETGRFNRVELKPIQEVAISTETPLGPQPELEFKDSGTSLSVTGRKVISLNYSSKRYVNDQTAVSRPRALSLFEITQQMQVRMQGKVGQKISVNVDYDDTKLDKQDISVVYQGDPNEVVQNVSFGDIDLSLPATEFVSYNKQLFGIRADLKTSRFKFTFVGSRTKGLTKTKQFTGNTQFQSVDILDTNYLRRKYYDVTFGNLNRLPIQSGSERIYIDQQSQAIVDGVTVFGMGADDLAVPSSSYTGRFQIMNPGIDYVMDYIKGIVTFNRTLNPQDVVIIDFENGNGTRLSQNTSSTTLTIGGTNLYKLIKTPNDIQIVPNSQEAGWNRELKTYYPIGQTNIVRDDGRGNFTLKVQDLNRNEVLSTLANNMPKYPDTIEVDFEQGIFNLKQIFTSDGIQPDAQIYSAAPVSKRIFRVEYSYRFKTFILEPSIVVQSENVRVDGVKINRNEEYFIDYDSGFITFYYPDRIRQDSKIEIVYEVSPFGGIGNQSMVGGRVSYDLSQHFSVGSTLLYQGGIKSNTVPNVTDLTNSMLVYEGDAQLKALNIFGLRTTLGGEVAQSRLNPNLNDNALVDNMEGIKQDDSPSLDANFWQIAANPLGSLYGPADPRALNWNSQDVKEQDINAGSTSDGTQQVLSVNYDFSISSEISIAYPLSPTGLDFSQKTGLEMIVYGDNVNGPLFNIHLGQINEDADGTGGQNFVCEKGLTLNNAPKNEDTNCDNQLAPAEDTGWIYKPAGKGEKRYGAGNGRMDSEDLNKNGRLDPQDFTGGDFGYITSSKFKDNTDNDSVDTNNIDFTGWHTLYTPIPITSTDTYRWNAVKQVRISLKYNGGPTSGVIKFARIAAVGNTWAVSQSTTANTGFMQLQAVNNIDNPGYPPIFSAGGDATDVFNKLYGSVSDQKSKTNSQNLSEQALAVNFTNITSSSTAYVYRKFTQPIDISQHEKFKFLLYSSATYLNADFFLQLGDENNNFRAEVPLDFTGWRLITIDQLDLNKDGIPERWVNGSNYTVTISSKGSPSLQQVPQIILGVAAKGGTTQNGTVYVNEIHVAKPLTRVGNARKVEGSFEIPGWVNFGGKHRYMDRNFQTPVTAIANQDNEQQTGYLNITRLAFLPLNFTAARQMVTTPNTAITGANNLVNSLQQGQVKRFDGTAAGNFTMGSLPRLGFNYAKNRTDYTLMARRDDRDVYTGNLSYAVPLNVFILPNNITLNYSLGRNKVAYNAVKLTTTAASGLFATDERTDTYGAKLAFTPWRGSSFNPGYALSQVRETRVNPASTANMLRYPKSMQQTAEFNSNLMFFSWLNPGFNYSITTMENNNLNVTTITVLSTSAVFNVGEIKTITRNSQGAVNLTLNVNDLMPKNRLLRSMVISSNYQIQDGDSWANVEKGLDAKQSLWIRDSLKPKSQLAQRNSVTLRDTINSSQRWQPFEGFALKGAATPLNTVSVTNSFSNSLQKSEVTGTKTTSLNRTFPDMILSMSQLEILTRTAKWAQNATVNLKYSKNTNETKKISLDLSDTYGLDLRLKVLNYFDTAMSYNTRLTDRKDLRLNQKVSSTRHYDATLQSTFDYKKFRFTPKVDYVYDISKGGLGIVTQNTKTITPSLLIKTDLQLPKGLKLPFMKQVFVFTNRIIWTTTLNYAIKKSPVTVADNNRLFSLNSSADYEAAKNLRLTFNAGLQRLWHNFLKQEEYISYQAGSTLTFQF
ncbi:MAG: hypothetical protein WCK75_02005 [Elusimicrobiota bacterium]